MKVLKKLIELKQELNQKECSLISLDEQLYIQAQIDILHSLLGYHPTWPKRAFEAMLEAMR